MDPVLKIWMYENWLADQNDLAELAKNHAYLLASFTYPEEVRKIMGNDNMHESNDEDFDESLRMVKEGTLNIFDETPKKEVVIRRKRRYVKG
jgi:hypothetical protein